MPLRFNHGFAVVMGPDGSLHYVPTPRNVQGIVTSRGASHVTLSFDQQFRQEFAMMEDRLREMEKINKKQQRKLVRYKQYKLQPVSESAQAKRLETENKQLQRTIRKLQTEISKLTSNAQTTYYQQTPATQPKTAKSTANTLSATQPNQLNQQMNQQTTNIQSSTQPATPATPAKSPKPARSTARSTAKSPNQLNQQMNQQTTNTQSSTQPATPATSAKSPETARSTARSTAKSPNQLNQQMNQQTTNTQSSTPTKQQTTNTQPSTPVIRPFLKEIIQLRKQATLTKSSTQSDESPATPAKSPAKSPNQLNQQMNQQTTNTQSSTPTKQQTTNTQPSTPVIRPFLKEIIQLRKQATLTKSSTQSDESPATPAKSPARSTAKSPARSTAQSTAESPKTATQPATPARSPDESPKTATQPATPARSPDESPKPATPAKPSFTERIEQRRKHLRTSSDDFESGDSSEMSEFDLEPDDISNSNLTSKLFRATQILKKQKTYQHKYNKEDLRFLIELHQLEKVNNRLVELQDYNEHLEKYIVQKAELLSYIRQKIDPKMKNQELSDSYSLSDSICALVDSDDFNDRNSLIDYIIETLLGQTKSDETLIKLHESLQILIYGYIGMILTILKDAKFSKINEDKMKKLIRIYVNNNKPSDLGTANNVTTVFTNLITGKNITNLILNFGKTSPDGKTSNSIGFLYILVKFANTLLVKFLSNPTKAIDDIIDEMLKDTGKV